MRKAVLSLVLTLVSISGASAGVWEAKCAGCHNGSFAPTKEQLLKKYRNGGEFVAGVMASKSPMMAAIKQDKETLKKVVRELYNGKMGQK